MLTPFILASLAHAGAVQVDKKGLLPAHIWVDGALQGKLKNKNGFSTQLDPGSHEVWISMDDDGVVTRCHGTIDGSKNATLSVRDTACDGFNGQVPNEGKTAFRGASVLFKLGRGVDAWVSVDGGRAWALPSMPFELNLAPGQHTIVLYNDVHQESVFSQGTVKLDAGQQSQVTCTPGGCLGFEQPAIILIAPDALPALQLNVQVN